MFGDKEFSGVGYPTPLSIPDETTCVTVNIPNDPTWSALLTGVLLTLIYPENWQQFEGGITRDDAAERWQQIVDEMTDETTCLTVDTPFWDDETDVDDEMPAEDQIWYGGVTDPTVPPGELDFVESALLWAVTGFVAIATFEVGGLAPAIFFHTSVEKFILIQKRGDVAETIRYVIDNQDMRMLDTSPYAPGELIEVPLIAPPSDSGHDIMIVQVT